MGVFKQFATNKKLEVEGIRLPYEPNPDGTVPTLIVRRIYRESPKYQAIFARITKPYKHQIDRDEISEADDARLMQRIFVEAAVVGWENWRMPAGVAGGKGEGPADLRDDDRHLYDMPFSFDACAAVLAVLPDMWRDAAFKAGDADSYKVGELEDMAKN